MELTVGAVVDFIQSVNIQEGTIGSVTLGALHDSFDLQE